ncbi:MAG: type II secretion system protein GspD [Planctomycetota bacterium]
MLRVLVLAASFVIAAVLLLRSIHAQSQPQASTAPDATPSSIESPVLAKVDFRDLPLFDACRLLADQTGLNIVPSQEAGQQNVSLYLRDVTGLAAIEALCKAHQLWFQRDPSTGMVRISTTKEYRGNLSNLREEKTEFFSLMYPNAIDVGYAIRNLFGSRVLLRSSDTDSEVMIDLQDRFSRFDLLDSRTQGLGLNGNFGQGYGQNGSGYGSGGGYGYGADGGTSFGAGYANRGGLRSFETQQDPAAQAQEPARDTPLDLSSEDIMRVQDMLAGGALTASKRSELYEVLARNTQSPIYVTIANRQNKLVARTADEHALEQIRTIVEKLDVPTALVLLEVRVLAIDLLDGLSSFFDYQFAGDDTAGAFSTGNIAQPEAPALGPAGTGLRAGELVFQYVDSHFAVRMQALERDNRVRSLSTPVLLTANNEVCRLFVGREVPLNRSFSGGQVVSNDDSTQTVSGSTQIEFRPVGTTLLITPNINADRTVTLRVVQENSNTDTTATVLVPDEEGFTQQTVSVVSSQSVSGTIVAKSELAVVFGGLIEESVIKQKEQVPILGDIPLIGVLFQRNNDVKTRREIVIVVRPYVLSTPSESEAASGKLLQALGSDAQTLGVPSAQTPNPTDPNAKPPPRPRFHFHGLDPDEK